MKQDIDIALVTKKYEPETEDVYFPVFLHLLAYCRSAKKNLIIRDSHPQLLQKLKDRKFALLPGVVLDGVAEV